MATGVDYGPAMAALLDPPRKMPLGAGQPNETARPSLDVPTSSLFGQPVRDPDMAAGCHAALWLRHDFLPVSHRLCQKIGSVEGSYWHGIMHRREGDFGNAKHWFRRVREHPVSTALAGALPSFIGEDIPEQPRAVAMAGEWNAAAFVDLCEAAVFGDADLRAFCEDVQEREWGLLFAHCFSRAVA